MKRERDEYTPTERTSITPEYNLRIRVVDTHEKVVWNFRVPLIEMVTVKFNIEVSREAKNSTWSESNGSMSQAIPSTLSLGAAGSCSVRHAGRPVRGGGSHRQGEASKR